MDLSSITLGAVLIDGECNPDPIVQIPLAMLNRHGLIAGATGSPELSIRPMDFKAGLGHRLVAARGCT